MVRFSLNIKTCSFCVICEKEDQIWANVLASPKICTPAYMWVHGSLHFVYVITQLCDGLKICFVV